MLTSLTISKNTKAKQHNINMSSVKPYQPIQYATPNAHQYESEVPVAVAESYPLKHSSPPTVQGTRPYALQNRYVCVESRHPVTLTYCPSCAKEQTQTYTRTKANGTTFLCVVAGVIIFWPLAWIPLVMRSAKQTNHHCSNCGVKVGRVKPFCGRR